MNPTLALIWLLAACPFFDASVPVRVLEPVAFAQVAPRGAAGFAVWRPGPSACRITLRAPVIARVACHEYQHCVQGAFHE